MAHIFRELVNLNRKEEIERVLDSPEEWKTRAKNAALNQMSQKNYKDAKDILLFVIKKRHQNGRESLQIPKVVETALLTKQAPPPSRKEAPPPARNGLQGSQSRDLDLFRDQMVDASLRQSLVAGGQQQNRVFTDLMSSTDGSCHASLMFDTGAASRQASRRASLLMMASADPSRRNSQVHGVEELASNGGELASDGGSSLKEGDAKTITVRVRITHMAKDQPPQRNHNLHSHAHGRSQRGSLTELTQKAMGMTSINTARRHHAKKEAQVQHRESMSYQDSLVADIINALNDVDWVIRNDQVEVNLEVDDDLDVFDVYFSDSADVGTDVASSQVLADNFIAQATARGSRLKRIALRNEHCAYDIVSAEQVAVARKSGENNLDWIPRSSPASIPRLRDLQSRRR